MSFATRFRAAMKEFMPDFKDKQVTSALKKLTAFSFTIICLPLSSMFLSKVYVFEGEFLAYVRKFMPDFKDKQVTSALKKLTAFSFTIICLPLSSMFLSKVYVFEGIFNYPPSDSIIYGAIVAVVLVHIILFAYVYIAWNEDEKTAEKED